MSGFSNIEELTQFAQRLLGGQKRSYVVLKESPKHTTNLFGTLEDLRGVRLQLVEKNEQGDCMVLHPKDYLVDVDHRDIQMIVNIPEGF